MSSIKIDTTDVLALLLSQLQIDFDDIDQHIHVRKFIQKSIYLLQLPKYGFNLGYRYGLYLAGPYSSKLSDEYYYIADNLDVYKRRIRNRYFDDKSKQKLGEFVRKYKDDYDLLECVATLHFLNNATFAYISKKSFRKKAIVKYLRKIKPRYKNKRYISKVNKALSIVSVL